MHLLAILEVIYLGGPMQSLLKQVSDFTLILFVIIVLDLFALHAQGTGINTTGAAADNSAILDVSSTTQGALFPRMTQTQRTSIASPQTGLLVYQTDGTTGFYYNSGTSVSPNWVLLTVGGNTAGGDLSGSLPSPTVAGLRGRTVSSSTPATNDVLQWNGSTWAPGTVSAGGTVGGDLSGSLPNPTVAALRGHTVSATSPSTGDVLQWSGSNWAPVTISTGTGAGSVQVFDASVGSTQSYTISDLAVRYVFFDGKGRSFSGVTITITLPAASSYPAGTIIAIALTNYITSATTAINMISPNSTLNAFSNNNTSTNTATSIGNTAGSRLMTDGVSKWYRLLN